MLHGCYPWHWGTSTSCMDLLFFSIDNISFMRTYTCICQSDNSFVCLDKMQESLWHSCPSCYSLACRLGYWWLFLVTILSTVSFSLSTKLLERSLTFSMGFSIQTSFLHLILQITFLVLLLILVSKLCTSQFLLMHVIFSKGCILHNRDPMENSGFSMFLMLYLMPFRVFLNLCNNSPRGVATSWY